MPAVFPFRAIQYAAMGDQSALVAPPYDVLDAAGKERLLAKDARNIVGIDLPHTPAKELGPPTAYAQAGERWRLMLNDGTLARSSEPVMFAYRQTWRQPEASMAEGTVTVSRCGMACCVETAPFGPRAGGGILPHEETFSGPKEDRMALMKATRAQLSPIFGLHADDTGRATALLKKVMASRTPDRTARTEDGTLHEVWAISDRATMEHYAAALAGEDVFIADGHHRYNTALNYLKLLESQASVPADHPARRTMMVLVGMSDPGLVIWPTHRVLGGMRDYSIGRFLSACEGVLDVREYAGGLGDLPGEMRSTTMPPPPLPRNVFGLYDFATRRSFTAMLVSADPLATRFATKPRAWRELDVAIVQHVIVEQICVPKLNDGQPVTWAFPHTIHEIEQIGAHGRAATGPDAGARSAQLAIVLRPTPLEAVREVSRAGELMPQKSTFFYPKLATGLFMHGLE